MRKIVVKNFKAFQYKFELKLKDEKNALICGENGAGKSSLFAAMRYAYLKNEILANLNVPGAPEEEVAANISDYKASFRNQRKNEEPFSIEVNSCDVDGFEPADEFACFISREMVLDRKELSLLSIAKAILVKEEKARTFLETNSAPIIASVNDALQVKFYEYVTVQMLEEGDWKCQLIDRTRGLNDGVSTNLDMYFNEARLNLIILLFMLEMAKFLFEQSGKNKRLLVCDDLVTSLDMTNRQMMINYVLDTFEEEQKIIFTHNVSFFNFFQYVIKIKYNTSKKWHFFSMYEVAHRHRIYEYGEMSVQKIKAQLATGKTIQSVGNEIRKYFEALLVELSRIHYTEHSVEKMETLLDNLKNNPVVYVLQSGQKVWYADDLVKKIDDLTNSGLQNNALLVSKIKTSIRKYKKANTKLQPLTQTLKSMEMFQKLVLHPLSHGGTTYPSVSIREETIILDLLSKLEKLVNMGRKKNGNIGNVTDM